MPHAAPLTFQQALKKNLKRVLTFWAPLSVIFAGLGTLLGFYTLSTYASAIGRPDLMAAAMEAKSALVPWLATVIGMLGVYLLILLATTVLFGLTVSLFNDFASEQHKLVGVLFVPVLVGIIALLWQIFEGPQLSDWGKLFWTVGWLVVSLLALLLVPVFRVAVDTCATMASPGKPRSWPLRVWFTLMVALLLAATVLSAVFPASLILKAYIGEETPDAINRLMYTSMFAATVTLLPVVVFYVSKADLFKRLILSVLAVIVTGGLVIGISPGSPAAIVYSAAFAMNVRDPVAAHFMLTKTYAKEDFDTQVWGDVETVRGQPVISAFPLFSFGDVLLLCPAGLINKGRKDWPVESAYCVLTQSSNALRMPKKSIPAAGRETQEPGTSK
ncbi:hypothetical protein EXW72_06905 [Pseudomonas sp. BCA14]|uniref:hypothetical protein n=1 Tax=unclassified Pseudomonas TaxID=196821 RepID=UPI00106E3604|nr:MULTISPECIES: hypothetical protein [unclassified Pseudomonas]TFF13996.1 hypothetical protein EXW70_05585 [Pseudomonas sp. JMN1]TFF15321.1 hypothetical protein EXW71_03455 [Pseudomonas sp. BCA17]TFF31728.1 hypothetical protein EXW72_06905 [Pseudomonas sp. BCA14]TFF32680.1 hypothetical protein EXW73_02705 [Pseudomonas sp. BCA13]